MTAAVATDRPTVLEPLFEASEPASASLRGGAMPAELKERYGGPLAIALRADRPTLVANFVSTLDGIVAFGEGRDGGGPISGYHEPDRFVMGLLRALADAVVVAAGTVRASADGGWAAADVHPASAAATAAWRSGMGLAEHPTTVVVTGSGDLPADHPGLLDPAREIVVATSRHGAERLARTGVPGHVRVRALTNGDRVTGENLVRLGEALGTPLMLCEGGPQLLGELVAGDVLDELFLTLSPQLVGREGDGRRGLVEGIGLTPESGRWHELLSVRRSTDHLFLRYRHASDQLEKRA